MQTSDLRKTEAWIAAAMFLALAFNVPLLFHMFVVGGIVPYAGLLAIAVLWAGKVTGGVMVVVAVHLLVYGAILLALSVFIARRICAGSPAARKLRMLIFMLPVFCLGMLPIFGFFDSMDEAKTVYSWLAAMPKRL